MSLKRSLAFAAALFLPMSVMAEDPMKVGFVYVGPIGDHGWSYQHDQGRLALEEHFGDKVATTYVKNVNEGADAERTIRRLAQAGNEGIFTTSFGFMNGTMRVAKEYPDVTFLHATGYKSSDNVGTYLSETYEGRYVTGTAAGLVTKTNTKHRRAGGNELVRGRYRRHTATVRAGSDWPVRCRLKTKGDGLPVRPVPLCLI